MKLKNLLKKAPEIIEPKKHLEILSYVHKGITVRVEIDYDAGEISLLDKDDSNKRWIFAGRSIRYMECWKNVLDAMKFTIEEATERLKKSQGEKINGMDFKVIWIDEFSKMNKRDHKSLKYGEDKKW